MKGELCDILRSVQGWYRMAIRYGFYGFPISVIAQNPENNMRLAAGYWLPDEDTKKKSA